MNTKANINTEPNDFLIKKYILKRNKSILDYLKQIVRAY